MPNAMWLRGEVFDHGLLHLALLERDPEPSNASTGRAFDRIGRCLIGLRSRSLGSLLMRDNLPASARILEAVWNEAAEPGDRVLTEDQCICLLQIFAALKPRAWRSDRQAEAEFVLFLAVQLFFHARIHVQRDDQVCWPSSDAIAIDPPQALSAAEQHQRIANAAESGLHPCTPKTLRAHSPRSLALRAIGHESDERLDFIKTHVRDIFWLVSLCDELSARSSFLERWNLKELSADVVRALGFLLSDGKELRPLCSRQEAKVSCLELEMLLGRSLVLNDEANPRPGPALDPDTPVPDDGVSDTTEVATDDDDEDDDEDNHNASTGGGAPMTHDPRQQSVDTPLSPHFNIVIYNARRRTIHEACDEEHPTERSDTSPNPSQATDGAATANSSSSSNNNNNNNQEENHAQEGQTSPARRRGNRVVDKVAIFACKSSYIYVLIMGITRNLAVGNSYDCKINMHTLDARPVLFGDCRGLELGPFNTFYPRLGRHLLQAGIDARVTFPTTDFPCLKPIDITDQTAAGAAWTLLQPAEFAPFAVPFPDPGLHDACRDNPVGLPPAYAQSLFQKVDRVESLLRRLSTAYLTTDDNDLDPGFEDAKESDSPTNESKSATSSSSASSADTTSRKQQLERAFQDAFRDWLATSGNARQIIDLIKLQPNDEAAKPSSLVQ
ncbi:TBCC domain-containing protein 1 [Hondaea fermentalgiana]|uniref:TBCC domain-containing protein 1 n=1 Tax=Hondaea fermentalgiana TaxID=2315210 RepID=A0A2R5G8S2_9STRA|nr:TBCC domain-containing protein 1 [Hondaea fermentalgiana]|eukprot:GBG27400.1 TBCC domain-containing protein 1 [Hondaea fermentalgiana]